MSFIDENTEGYADDVYTGGDYSVEDSPIGKVFIPKKGVDIIGDIVLRYEKHPWLEQFEFDGIRPRIPRREGYGFKTARPFAESLAKIYSKAYDDYAAMCSEEYVSEENKDGLNIEAYYAKATGYFVQLASTAEGVSLYRKFCGFSENLWREGTKTMHDVAMEVVLSIIEKNPTAAEIFYDSITQEFREYIEKEGYGEAAKRG